MCQAIFAMKFAKKYGIMVDVNKKVWLCCANLSDLYNMHKNTIGFLLKTENWKENCFT